MNRFQKKLNLNVRNPTYRQVFARLDAFLAKKARNALSDVEKIDRLRRAVFGELPEDNPSGVNELQMSEASPDRDRPLKS
jgi:hypothetical protein